MAWDFAAEIHSLTAYDADDASTASTSGEVLSAHINQWLNDGAKEIIMQLPSSLQEQCVDKTSVTSASALDFNTATVGKLLYCTRNNGSYDKPCREVAAVNASLLDDSTAANYYATADDPAFFIRDNKAEIKPDPDGNGASFYHIVFPSALTYDDNSITNFPDEAEYLVVLYAAQKSLQYLMTTMTAGFNSDITAALTAVNDALDRINANVWADAENYGSGDLLKVKDALDKARTLITDDAEHAALSDVTDEPSSGYSALQKLGEEDTELVASTLSIVSMELNRASAELSEITAISGVAVQEATGYISEVGTRLQVDVTKYGWYNDQWTKLNAQYSAGLAVLKGS